MIYSNEFVRYTKTQKDTIRKLMSFADRCPVLVSVKSDESGITVIHTSTGTEYKFLWSENENVEPKDFVAKVKEVLVRNHYPRLVRTYKESRPYTPHEVAEGLIQGKTVEDFENGKCTELKEELYRIESVMLWENKFILKQEDDDSGTAYIYRLHSSGAIFLTKYRNNEFRSIEEAGDYFFSNADLIKVIQKEAED